jgi:class 3 adenylate cyclase
MARFGYPKAHEDDADRAVRCGLEMIKAVGALKVPIGPKLEIRAGIATGVVVVGEQSAPEVGETPYLAARLQGLAEPDSIVIADSTKKLIGTLFECSDIGTVAIKGYDDPVDRQSCGRSSNDHLRKHSMAINGSNSVVAIDPVLLDESLCGTRSI